MLRHSVGPCAVARRSERIWGKTSPAKPLKKAVLPASLTEKLGQSSWRKEMAYITRSAPRTRLVWRSCPRVWEKVWVDVFAPGVLNASSDQD